MAVDMDYIIRRFKTEGKASEGIVALWLGKGGYEAYRVYKQLRDLCEEGFLDDDEFKCISSKRMIVLRPIKQKPTTDIILSPSRTNRANDDGDIDNILSATPSESKSKPSVIWNSEEVVQ